MAKSSRSVDRAAVFEELQAVCNKIRAKMRLVPPEVLLRLFWGRAANSVIAKGYFDEGAHDCLPSFSYEEQSEIFALEYLHASVSVDGVSEDFHGDVCESATADEIIKLSDNAFADRAFDGGSKNFHGDVCAATADEIIKLSNRALDLCMKFGFPTVIDDSSNVNLDNPALATQMLKKWIFIRGRRFQVLEEEFFSYVLMPHNDALLKNYGISAGDLATEIQKIANLTGIAQVLEKWKFIRGRRFQVKGFCVDDVQAMENYGISAEDLTAEIQRIANMTGMGFDEIETRLRTLMAKIGLNPNDEDITVALVNVMDASEAAKEVFDDIFDLNDIFDIKAFNLSRLASIPESLLGDLAYEAGTNREFCDGSEISGTPLNALPARTKPVVKLGDDFYCTEPHFIRDASYGAIQRALLESSPARRKQWHKNQKIMLQSAFADIMADHLSGARVFKGLYYPVGNKKWAEIGCVIMLGDVLINVESSTEPEVLTPSKLDLMEYTGQIERIVQDAYKQTKRFIDHIYVQPEVALYERTPNGKYKEVVKIQSSMLRKVFPVGLTVESHKPFCASIKQRGKTPPIQDEHEFVSLSIDDLVMIRKILRGTGQFMHYLEVRQALAAIKATMTSDEADYLGIYIEHPEIVRLTQMVIKEEGEHEVTLLGFGEHVLAPYFCNQRWPDYQIPSQNFPQKIIELLEKLEQDQDKNWLEANSFIRGMSQDSQALFADTFAESFPRLEERQGIYLTMSGEDKNKELVVFGLAWFSVPNLGMLTIKKAEVYALALGVKRLRFFEIIVKADQKFLSAKMIWVPCPTVLNENFSEIKERAAVVKREMKI